MLRDIQRLLIPRGWGLPVVPGTQFVTVGGAIANDVHGKNYHEGTFGDHVRWLRWCAPTARRSCAGPPERPDLFAATVGGLGLTGVIVDAELQLRATRGPGSRPRRWLFDGLDEFFRLSEEFGSDWEDTVSWIDCTFAAVRGLFMRARPVTGEQDVARIGGSPCPSRRRSRW